MVLPTVIKKRHLKGGKSLPVIKRIRAGQPGGFKEFGRLQNDTTAKSWPFGCPYSFA
jgi:hypothetical protein